MVDNNPSVTLGIFMCDLVAVVDNSLELNIFYFKYCQFTFSHSWAYPVQEIVYTY